MMIHIATDLNWEVVEAMEAILFTTADLAEIIDIRFEMTEMTNNASIAELWVRPASFDRGHAAKH